MNEESTTAFRICSAKVRRISCSRCPSFRICRKQGAPVSELANYLTWLKTDALPRISEEINKGIRPHRIGLFSREPSPDTEDFIYYTICGINIANNYMVFKVELSKPLEFAALRRTIINAFLLCRLTKGIRNNGK